MESNVQRPISRRTLDSLREAGGRMTKRQWIRATCLLKREVLAATEEHVRKTKNHVILIDDEGK